MDGRLAGIQAHIDAVSAGEPIETRLPLIEGSNMLSDEEKRRQAYFLKAFCLMAALDPYCGTTIELEPGLSLRLNRRRELIEGNELPGVRTDSDGWLVIEGDFMRNGVQLTRFEKREDGRFNPRWPLMLRNPPVSGGGPWPNYLPQAIELLKHVGRSWPS